jgi:Caspase domain
MTRIYQDPAPAADAPSLRALILGAGHYANAQVAIEGVPRLPDLSSVGQSVRKFAAKLIGDWRSSLEAPLLSVDLLLCEPEFEVSRWMSSGAEGEGANDTPIDPPTLANVRAALTQVLEGAKPADHFVFMCCGHGFSKDKSYFILSDFGSNTDEVWSNVVNVTDFFLGMGQKEPRKQWFFVDCCADIPEAVLKVLTPTVGQALVTPDAGKLGTALLLPARICKPGRRGAGDRQPPLALLRDASGGHRLRRRNQQERQRQMDG